MRGKYGLLLVIVLMALFVEVKGEPTHIHLTWQGDPRSTITVSWRTLNETPGVVEYGVGLPNGNSTRGSLARIHHINITGLEPGTLYHYRCGCESDWSEELTFRTAPGDSNEPFTFVAFGDSRTNWDIWGNCSEAVLASGAEFSVHVGDLVSHGGDQGEWDIWFEEAKELLGRKVMMPTIGNHECTSSGGFPRYPVDPKYFEHFALPQPKEWYSFDYGNAHFIALNTETEMNGSQRDWLKRDLSSTNATWKFVFFHRPMYSSSLSGCIRRILIACGDLFDEYHVDMVFMGHDHDYERSYPIYDDWLVGSPGNGTIYIVTGGAGAPLKYGRLISPGPWCASFLTDYSFVLLHINETELHMEAKLLDGTVFDEIQISKAVLPDLRVESIATNPRYPRPGEATTVVAMVKNLGQRESRACSASFAIDGETVSTTPLPSLPPGGLASLEIMWLPTIPGPCNLTVWADCDDKIGEGIWETNNKLNVLALVSEEKPDLVVVDVGCSEIMPDPGEVVTFWVDVKNEGSGPSGSFNLGISLDGILLNLSTCSQGLGPDEKIRFTHSWTCARGDWEIVATADPKGEVDELFEGNNIGEGILHFRDFFKEGAAYISQGFEKGEGAIVYYDQSEGPIPSNSSTIVVVWGMNGWKRPDVYAEVLKWPLDDAPDTVARVYPIDRGQIGSKGVLSNFVYPRMDLHSTLPDGKRFVELWETKMEKVTEDLWLAALPTTEEMEWIDLMFQDRCVLARYWDTNNGSIWIVPSREWSKAKVDELADVIGDARAVGLEVSSYLDVLIESNRSYYEGCYSEVIRMIENGTDRVDEMGAELCLKAAEWDYGKALFEGLDVERVQGLIVAARSRLESEDYAGSKRYSCQILDTIKKIRAQINEWILLPILPISLAFSTWRGTKRPQPIERALGFSRSCQEGGTDGRSLDLRRYF